MLKWDLGGGRGITTQRATAGGFDATAALFSYRAASAPVSQLHVTKDDRKAQTVEGKWQHSSCTGLELALHK